MDCSTPGIPVHHQLPEFTQTHVHRQLGRREEPAHWKRPWCWERSKAGEGDDRGWDGWMASPTWRTWVWASSKVKDREAWHAAVHRVAKSQTRLSDWTTKIQHTGASQVALVVKILTASAGDTRNLGLIPESGRSPRVGNGNSLQYTCLENSMDRGAWQATQSTGLQWVRQHWVTELACTQYTKQMSLPALVHPFFQANSNSQRPPLS